MLFLLTIASCTQKTVDDNTAGYISIDENSSYQRTFDDLDIGEVFNYNFHWLKAKESWVSIWLEGYSNGQLIEPKSLGGMKYGLSPHKEENGKIGFGVINTNQEPLVFFYSNGTRVHPSKIQENILTNKGISTWEYGIDEGEVAIKYNEEIILAMYRQNNNSIRSGYDYSDEEGIQAIIEGYETVLFLKIKIEKAN